MVRGPQFEKRCCNVMGLLLSGVTQITFKYVFRLFSSCSSSYLSSFCSSYCAQAFIILMFLITCRTHVVRLVSTNDKPVAKGHEVQRTPQTQETKIHVLGGIRTRDPKRLQTCTIDLTVTGIDPCLGYTLKLFEVGVLGSFVDCLVIYVQ